MQDPEEGEVDDPTREGVPDGDVEDVGDEEADPIQEGVNHIEERTHEEEHILDWFRNPGDKAGQGNPEEETCVFLTTVFWHQVVHSQAGSWQPEHHS